MVNLKDLLLGKLPSIPLSSYKDWCSIQEDITIFVLLRYSHYVLSWDFDYPFSSSILNENAIFFLIVNGYDELAREKIIYLDKKKRNNETFMWTSPLNYCTLDDFKPASKEMCQWLLATYPESAVWHYYVTGWSLMGDYDLPNLKYARDHVFLAKRLGKSLVIDKVEIFVRSRSVTFDKDKFGDDGDDLITNKGFNQVDINNIDKLCKLFVSHKSGMRAEIYDGILCTDHDDHEEEFPNE